MTVSIIICTRNRAGSLRLTLESINRAVAPAGWSVEMVLVDNGSTDDTLAVAGEARLDKIAMRCVTEPEIGLSNARNTGISLATGEIIIFTDDDVRVPVDWLAGMCDPIIEGRADAIAGGVVYPPHVEGALKRLPIGGRQVWFGTTSGMDAGCPSRLIGANMAFHRRVLDKVPGFDVELGAGALGYGEETVFSFQLLAAGYTLAGAFDVAVEHHFDASRVTEANLMEMARKMGRSEAFIFHHWEHKKTRLSVPKFILYYLRRNWMGRFGMGGSLEEALEMEEYMAFFREYRAQRNRPWKYPAREGAPASPA